MQVTVKQAFRLNINGTHFHYDVGVVNMPEEHFNHRYTKFFIEPELPEIQEMLDVAIPKSTPAKKRVKK